MWVSYEAPKPHQKDHSEMGDGGWRRALKDGSSTCRWAEKEEHFTAPRKTEKGESLSGPDLGSFGNSSVVELLIQNRNLEYGEPRCGFNKKHQSTIPAMALPDIGSKKGNAIVLFPQALKAVSRLRFQKIIPQKSGWPLVHLKIVLERKIYFGRKGRSAEVRWQRWSAFES